ncbi:hypothetical protein [Yoonia sp. BS5-3]|uniref:Uncharacterized protein n=1 Tax=Yoonia phaeophyticola TaxID=3137369 RepID=A0ABZ2V1R2_9RHOB
MLTLFSGITFYEICMALLMVGMTERVLLAYAPIEMVGPDGWLLKADVQE